MNEREEIVHNLWTATCDLIDVYAALMRRKEHTNADKVRRALALIESIEETEDDNQIVSEIASN